jgi:T4 superinfection immunity protein
MFYTLFFYITMLIVFAFLNSIPALIAIRRNHKNQIGIFALNVLLGWTIIGWVVAFIWALSGPNSNSYGAANTN